MAERANYVPVDWLSHDSCMIIITVVTSIKNSVVGNLFFSGIRRGFFIIFIDEMSVA